MNQDTGIKDVKAGVRQAGRTTEQVATGRWMTRFARFGYAVKGIVYLIIGILAAQLAIGNGGSATDQRGALRMIYQEPFGKVLLIVMAVGLFAFALWSFIQAILDVENKGHDAKGIIARVGYAVTGISYGLLGFGAYQLVVGTGNGGKSSGASTQDWTAQLFKQPFGVALVVLIGLVIIGLAGYMFFRAYSANFRHHFTLSSLDPYVRKAAMFAGRFGHAALGVDFLIVGIFLVIAALQQNPQKVKGLDTALQTLLQQPFGPVLLTIVALGFIAYGVFSFVEARYRHIGKSYA